MLKSIPIRFLILSLVLPLQLAAQELIDGLAAIVGDKMILKSDVLQLAQMNALQIGLDLTNNSVLLAQYQEHALNLLLTQKILIARAKVDSLDEIPSADVDQALDQQIDNIMTQVGTESRFEEVLKQSVREFRTERWFDIRDQIIADRYQSDKINYVSITRHEVEEFYHTYRDSLPPMETRLELSQIIVPINPGTAAKEQAYVEITDIAQRLAQGEDFSDLARQYSDDPASRIQGGDLGYVRRGEFVREFEETAFKLNNRETSEIVKTVFGYHIIQLLEKQGERINVRHILINVEPTEQDREKALERIREYYFLLSENLSLFDSLVTALGSSEESLSSELGYIGWVTLAQLPNESYRTALFGLRANEISPPFETPDGFHILNVLRYQEGGSPTLEDFYPQIEALALRNKQTIYFNNWLENIRSEVFIKIL